MRFLLLMTIFLFGCAQERLNCVQRAMNGATPLTYEQAAKVCGVDK